MKDRLITLFFCFASPFCYASSSVYFHQAPIHKLEHFFGTDKKVRALATNNSYQENLQKLNQTQIGSETIARFQQLYHGVPVVSAEITISQNSKVRSLQNSVVNGNLFEKIDIDTTPSFDQNQANSIAQQNTPSLAEIHDNKAELQIRNHANKLILTYLVSFKGFKDQKPSWPHFVIDAHSGKVLHQWDNIKHFKDIGPGGNEKLHEYWYGKEGLPELEVTQKGENCFLEDEQVTTVNLHSKRDWENQIIDPIQYSCGHNVEDFVNGAFSVGNDAYFWGHIIVNFYKDWFAVPALQDKNGNAQRLIMRVHFGEKFENAFWNGVSMNFGDGQYLYPLVSLGIAAHEVSHGYTEQHSNLEYHDESGALNESFSDMASQVSRAYLLEKYPQLYNKSNVTPNELTWILGEEIIPSSLPLKAIRFLDLPSQDGESADCLDKELARDAKGICAISYPELLNTINSKNLSPQDKQSAIVHTASGIFNRVFYLMTQEMTIQQAFQIMLLANTKFWTATTDFKEAACGVLHAAKESNQSLPPLVNIFNKVGISTIHCNY